MDMYCLFRALPIQAGSRVRGTVQPQANQLLAEVSYRLCGLGGRQRLEKTNFANWFWR